MRAFRITITLIRLIYRFILLIPKLQQAAQNEKDPHARARIQQKIIHRELSQIPEYRELVKKNKRQKTNKKTRLRQKRSLLRKKQAYSTPPLRNLTNHCITNRKTFLWARRFSGNTDHLRPLSITQTLRQKQHLRAMKTTLCLTSCYQVKI